MRIAGAVALLMLLMSPGNSLGSRNLVLDGRTPGWVRTGVFYQVGDPIRINATGCVSINRCGPRCDFGPDGRMCGSGELAEGQVTREFLCPDAPLWCLVGRIGNNAGFVIGRHAANVSRVSGELLVGFNDSVYDDNGGEYSLSIDAPNRSVPTGRLDGPSSAETIASCDGWDVCLNAVSTPGNAREALCPLTIPGEVLANADMGCLVLHRTVPNKGTKWFPTRLPKWCGGRQAIATYRVFVCSGAVAGPWSLQVRAKPRGSGGSVKDHRLIARAGMPPAPVGRQWSRVLMHFDLDDVEGDSIYLRAKYGGPKGESTSMDVWLILRFY